MRGKDWYLRFYTVRIASRVFYLALVPNDARPEIYMYINMHNVL